MKENPLSSDCRTFKVYLNIYKTEDEEDKLKMKKLCKKHLRC